jgi:hypothetical protein
MKTRWILLGILAVFAVSIALNRNSVRRLKQEQSGAPPRLELESSNSPDSTVNQKTPPPESRPNKSNEASEMEKLRGAVLLQNVKIDFVGRVIDQYANPVPGVRVVMECRRWGFLLSVGPNSQFPTHEALSDSLGMFTWKGTSGDMLVIKSLHKDGYLSSPTNLIFRYNLDNPSRTSLENPALVRLWKQTGSAPNLVRQRSFFGIVPDGRDHTVDLLKNKKYEGRQDGDLVIRIKRPQTVLPKQRYDWSIEIEGVDGGLVEKTDPFGYEAPEFGYNPVFEFKAKADAAGWSSGLSKQFYVRSRNGIFSYLQVEVYPEYQEKSSIKIEARINPNGSRSLEFQDR